MTEIVSTCKWVHMSTVSNDFNIVLIMVAHIARMAQFLPCIMSVTKRKLPIVFTQFTDYTDCPEWWLVTATRNSSVASDIRSEDAWEHDLKCRSVDTRRRMDERSESTTRYNNFGAVFVATIARIGQTCCLKMNSCTTLLTRSELSTHISRLILDFHLRSHLTYCSACDLQFQFRKTRRSG
jgi:hypothetical protein